jgi:hypothetical protein
MNSSIVSKSFVALIYIGLAIALSSCIKPAKSADFTFLIDETLLKDSLSLVEAITKFNCSSCPDNMDGYQDMLVPGKNSNIIIYNDSLKSARIFNIYNYNFFEAFAGSSVSPSRYFTHLNAQISKGFISNPTSSFSIDSLIQTIDSTYSIFTNFNFTTKPFIVHTSSLRDMPNKIITLKDDNNTKKNVLIYLKKNDIQFKPDTNFNPKKEIYNTMRIFYQQLSLLYIDSYSSEQKANAKALILQSFSPNAIFEIQNKDESSPTKYKINEFLDRITSNKKFQYKDVNFFINEFIFLKEPIIPQDSEIPGELTIANYSQGFKAINRGRVVYEDEVNKNVSFSIIPEEIANPTDGSTAMTYKYIIESVTVNYLK